MATFTDYSNWSTVDTSVSFRAVNSAPIDHRFVVDTYSNIKTVVPKSLRYPGLRVFVIDEEKEYWYKGGTANLDLVEYHPEANRIGTSLASLDTTHISDGAEAVVFTDNKPTKYIWYNGAWVAFEGESSGSSEPGTSSGSGSESTFLQAAGTIDTYEELTAFINSEYTSTTLGDELTILFNGSPVYCNKYIYLPDFTDSTQTHWYQESGTQVFSFTTPDLSSVADGTLVSDTSAVTIDKYISYYKYTDKVDIIIDHNFYQQFVDVQVYEKGTDTDADHDNVTDSDYGSLVMLPTSCILSNGKYRVVLSFVSYTANTDYVVVLQK